MRTLGGLLGAVVLIGCATESATTARRRHQAKLVLAQTVGVVNQSQRLNVGVSKRPRSVMLLGPLGVGPVQPPAIERDLERRLLASSVGVISPAVTGRVVAAPKNEDSDHLTTIERALVLARQSNADVIVQLDALDTTNAPTRHFCSDGRTDFRECTEGDAKVMATTRTFTAPEFVVRGRIVETSRGEVVSTVDVRTAVVNWLDVTYSDVDLNTSSRRYDCTTCSGSFCQHCAAAEARAWDAMLTSLVQQIATAPLRDD